HGTPTVAYTATLGGKPTSATWGVDKGNIGAISPTPSSQAVFTPTGTTGGLVTITASAGGWSAHPQAPVQRTRPAEWAQHEPGRDCADPQDRRGPHRRRGRGRRGRRGARDGGERPGDDRRAREARGQRAGAGPPVPLSVRQDGVAPRHPRAAPPVG